MVSSTTSFVWAYLKFSLVLKGSVELKVFFSWRHSLNAEDYREKWLVTLKGSQHFKRVKMLWDYFITFEPWELYSYTTFPLEQFLATCLSYILDNTRKLFRQHFCQAPVLQRSFETLTFKIKENSSVELINYVWWHFSNNMGAKCISASFHSF